LVIRSRELERHGYDAAVAAHRATDLSNWNFFISTAGTKEEKEKTHPYSNAHPIW
jgi:hypothetical protein